MSLRTFLLTLLAKGIYVTQKDYEALEKGGFIVFKGGTPILTDKGRKESGVQVWDFDSLAEKLREMTPRGSSENGVPWRSSKTDTSRRLKRFTEIYPEAVKYTEQDVINAYQAYIDFCVKKWGNPTTKYRSCLDYFIFRCPERGNKEETVKSKLWTYLEDTKTGEISNGSNEDNNPVSESWISTII